MRWPWRGGGIRGIGGGVAAASSDGSDGVKANEASRQA